MQLRRTHQNGLRETNKFFSTFLIQELSKKVSYSYLWWNLKIGPEMAKICNKMVKTAIFQQFFFIFSESFEKIKKFRATWQKVMFDNL